MSNQTKDTRYEFIILYFLGIILMVSKHADGGGIALMDNWFNPAPYLLIIFAFSSGYFFTKNINRRPIDIICNKLKKLIIPLYVWNIIYGIFVYFCKNMGIITYGKRLSLYNLFLAPIASGHQFFFNLAAWFLVPLFMLQIFSILFLPILKKKNGSYFVFMLYLLLGMFGVHLAIIGYTFKWWLVLTRFLYFLPFFGLGILYKEKLEKYDTLSNTVYFTIVFTLQLLLVFYNRGLQSYAPAWCQNFDNIWAPFLWGFVGIAFWFRLSKVLVPVLKDNKIVNIVSKNTFPIMMHHLLGFFILNFCLAFLSEKFNIFTNFKIENFRTNIRYIYNPKGVAQFKIFYVIFGIGTSLVISYIENKIKKLFLNSKNKLLAQNTQKT